MTRTLSTSLLAIALLTLLNSCAAELENPGGFTDPTGSAGGGGTGGGGTGGGGTGGGGTGGGGTGGVAACDAPTVVFALMGAQGGCDGPACHNNVFPPDLIMPGVAARVLDVDSLFCPGGKLVDSVNPANSFMLTKLAPSPMCAGAAAGAQMPSGFPPGTMTAEQVTCVTEWVNAIAAP